MTSTRFNPLSILAIIGLALLASSCSKGPLDAFRGTYTYKISGTVDVVPVYPYTQDGSVTASTLQIVGQVGVLDIITPDRKGKSATMVFNATLGEAFSVDAQIIDDVVMFKDSPQFTLHAGSLGDGLKGLVSASGRGTISDGILDMEITLGGELTSIGGTVYDIVGGSLSCIARKTQ